MSTLNSRTNPTIEKIEGNNIPRNIDIIYNTFDKESVKELLDSFGNDYDSNKKLIGQFLRTCSSQGKTLKFFEEMEIGFNFLKNYHLWKNFPKNIENLISRLLVAKLHKKFSGDDNMNDRLTSSFGQKKSLGNKSISFDSLNSFIELVVPPEYKNEIGEIKISNKEIFQDLGINELCKFTDYDNNEISKQGSIQDILCIEFMDTIEDLNKSMDTYYNYCEDFLTPMNYPIKHIDTKNLLDGVRSTLTSLKSLLENPISLNDIEILKTYSNYFLDKNQNIYSLLDKLIKSLEENSIENGQIKEIFQEINKMMWEKFFVFLEDEKKSDLSNIFKKLSQESFDFGILSDEEKTTLAQSFIPKNLSDKGYKNFLKNLYNFDENITQKISLPDYGMLNLKIKKGFKNGSNEYLQDFQNFQNMESLPMSFSVNLDDSDSRAINLLEDPENCILSREFNLDGVISSYTTKNGNMRIGNGYILEIEGKEITRDQLDYLLGCELENLEKELKNYGLYDSLWPKLQEVSNKESTIKADLEVDPEIDQRYGLNQLKNFQKMEKPFSRILSEIDVKILHRNLIFEGKNVNKISQLYLFSNSNFKNFPGFSKGREAKLNDLVHSDMHFREGNEGLEKGIQYAEEVFNEIGDDIDGLDLPDDDEDYEDLELESIIASAKEKYRELNDEGKETFKNHLRELGESSRDPDIQDCINTVISAVDEDDSQVHDNTNLDTYNTSEVQETPEEAWKNAWNKIKGVGEFETGTRLYFKTIQDYSDINLPPEEISDSYSVFEIQDVSGPIGSGTFSLKAIGDELKSKEKGIATYRNLPMTAEQLEVMLSSASIYKMPNRKGKESRGDSLQRVQNSGIIAKFLSFGNIDGQVKFEKGKLVNKDGEEIKYFDRSEDIYNPDTKSQGKDTSKYEILGIDEKEGTIKISSNIDGYEDNGSGGKEKVKYKYENVLTFEQFIIFMETKKLKGYTQKQQDIMEAQYKMENKDRLPGRGIFNWYSIGNFVSIFKDMKKKIGDKRKEISQEQEDNLRNVMLSKEGLNLYGHLGKILSFGGIWKDMEDACYELDLDYYNNRDGVIRKKIDKWYGKYKSDPAYPAEYATFLKSILSTGEYMGDNKDRYKFAAAVLQMLKKEGPYPRDFKNKIGEGFWVNSFLGPRHTERFKNFYAKKQQEINEKKDLGLGSGTIMEKMEELNKMEFTYIYSVIDGAEPYKSDDENAQKSIRSGKFAGEMKENLNSYFNSLEDEKKNIKTFSDAECQYISNLKNGKFNKALPALEVMCEKANVADIFRLKGYLLSAMMMGIVRYDSSKDTMKTFWTTARSMGFGPLCWIRDPIHQDKVKLLLDGISNSSDKIQNMKDGVKFDLNDFTPPGIKGNYEKFNAEFMGYWNANGREILKYIENPTYGGNDSMITKSNNKNDPNYLIYADIVKFNNDEDAGNMNRNVNSINFVKVAPLTANMNIIKMYLPKDDHYACEDEQQNDAKDAWKAIGNEISKGDPNHMEYYMKFFTNILGDCIDDREFVRTISLIQNLNKKGFSEEAKYVWRYIFRGSMLSRYQNPPQEFDECYEAFSKFFFNNIGMINGKMIKNVYDADTERSFNKPFKMVNWKLWNEKYGLGEKNNTTFNKELKLKGYDSEDTINFIIKTKKTGRLKNISSAPKLGNLIYSDVDVNFEYDEDNNTYREK